jgi:hypothetical protein
MNLRNIDGSEVINFTNGSHKKILFDCDICGKTVCQPYRTYYNQKYGKFCQVCRNRHSSSLPESKKKKSVACMRNWQNLEYRKKISKSLSIACKKAWDSERGQERKKEIHNKTPYEDVKSLIESGGYRLNTSKEEYEEVGKKISVTCDKGHTYMTNYVRFKDVHRCKACQKVDFDRIIKSFQNAGYELITKKEEYVNCNTKLIYRCPRGTIHSITWSNWNDGSRCPCCAKSWSKGEKEVLEYIKTIYTGKIIENDRTTILNNLTNRNLELDIWMPELNLAIEYNGLYWHSDEYSMKNDSIKLEECKNKGITLMIIMDNEWKSSSDEIKKKLKNIIFSG